MSLCVNLTAFVILLCSLTPPAWGQQYYLYEPRPVTAEEKNKVTDGVLVTEVSVQKGDTLYDISRKFSGHGMYYPQILLFNKIKNPNLIYPGNTLKVPVAHGSNRTEQAPSKEPSVKSKKLGNDDKAVSPRPALPGYEIPLSDLNKLDKGKNKAGINKNRAVSKGRDITGNEKAAATVTGTAGGSPSLSGDSAANQKLFEKAVKAYRQNNFRTALELFDQYLAANSNSPLAADASLYKAECYLKLSSQ